MALLLPCENEIVAHLLRSRLLSHGVECAVVHGGIATIWGNWLMHPRLLIAEDDLEPAYALLAEPEPQLDESFVEPPETADLNENLGFSSGVPGLPALVLVTMAVGLCIGVVVFAMVTALAMLQGGAARETAQHQDAEMWPLTAAFYGAVFGFIVWPLMLFARSCRQRPDGTLPLRARLIFLGARPEGWAGLLCYFFLRLLLVPPKALRN
jgi:hypothetical protein